MEADVPVAQQQDWSKLMAGIPSTAGVQDPQAKLVLDALVACMAYLGEKVKDVHDHPVMHLTDITRRPQVHGQN